MENNPAAIKSVGMVSIYADDFDRTMKFYVNTLGLTDVQPMGERACYIRFGRTADGNPYGMYIIGGKKPAPEYDPQASRTTFAFEVQSAGTLFGILRDAGVILLQDEPMDMGGGWFWFNFLDPAGNVIEILGER